MKHPLFKRLFKVVEAYLSGHIAYLYLARNDLEEKFRDVLHRKLLRLLTVGFRQRIHLQYLAVKRSQMRHGDVV